VITGRVRRRPLRAGSAGVAATTLPSLPIFSANFTSTIS
jgi:hypothetical protein